MIYTMCNHMNESLIRKNVCSQTFLTNRFRVSFACNLEYIYTARSGVTDMGLSKSFMFCVGGILGIVQESYGYQFPLILLGSIRRSDASNDLSTFSIRLFLRVSFLTRLLHARTMDALLKSSCLSQIILSVINLHC